VESLVHVLYLNRTARCGRPSSQHCKFVNLMTARLSPSPLRSTASRNFNASATESAFRRLLKTFRLYAPYQRIWCTVRFYGRCAVQTYTSTLTPSLSRNSENPANATYTFCCQEKDSTQSCASFGGESCGMARPVGR